MRSRVIQGGTSSSHVDEPARLVPVVELTARSEGARVVSLSGVPLAKATDPDSTLRRAPLDAFRRPT